jgi:hypothetical protein
VCRAFHTLRGRRKIPAGCYMSLPSVGRLLLSQSDKRRDSPLEGMDLNTLLNTNRHAIAAGHPNMQYEVPMPLSMSHDMSGAPHYTQQNLYVPNGASRIKTENGSDRGVSPHTSEQSSRYSSQTPQTTIAYQQIASQLSNGMRYPSPTQIPGGNMPLIQHSYHPNAPTDQAYPQAQMGAVQAPVQPDTVSIDGGSRASNPLPKAFACSTCSKGFARRSDLARHGKSDSLHNRVFQLTSHQNAFTVALDRTYAITLVVASNSFSAAL